VIGWSSCFSSAGIPEYVAGIENDRSMGDTQFIVMITVPFSLLILAVGMGWSWWGGRQYAKRLGM
jgi:hypothetical protein